MGKGFWAESVKALKRPRALILAALMTALVVVLGFFYLPIGENLRVMFTFVPMALGGMLCGPIVGLMIGFVSDLIGFFVHPSGPFFFGYTLSAMLSGFIYGLFLYRARVSFVRILLTKACVNALINVGLGCLWSMLLYGKAYWVAFGASIMKNLLLLPVEAWVVFLLALALRPLLPRLGNKFPRIL